MTACGPLAANTLISCLGVNLHGSGFIVAADQAAAFWLGTVPGAEQLLRGY